LNGYVQSRLEKPMAAAEIQRQLLAESLVWATEVFKPVSIQYQFCIYVAEQYRQVQGMLQVSPLNARAALEWNSGG